jgi:hypothetical protein
MMIGSRFGGPLTSHVFPLKYFVYLLLRFQGPFACGIIPG